MVMGTLNRSYLFSSQPLREHFVTRGNTYGKQCWIGRKFIMSRIYAVREDNGGRFLHVIKCDSCGEEITPNPDISSFGWVKCGRKSPYSDEVLE